MGTGDDAYKIRFGVDLVRAREGRGKNRSEFAKDIVVSSNGAKKWETGEVFPEPKWWKAISSGTFVFVVDFA